MESKILCGADRIDEYRSIFAGKRLGLVTNPSGVQRDFRATADKLAREYTLTAMYSPEHGVRGDRQDGQDIDTYVDEETGVTVYSIYGKKRSPDPEDLAGIDMMVYDIQDVGSRYYTYLYTMTNCMTVCARLGIPFVVLDRPNLIGGLSPEGTHMRDDCRSFIGMYDIPQRFSLTCGELACLINREFGIGARLEVVPLKNWTRSMYWADTGLPWINPSPNIAGPDAALLYNGTCLFEGTTLSEGRGTTRPFELIGAPWLNAVRFAAALEAQDCPGVRFRPAGFVPMFGKHAGELCRGVQVHVTDPRRVRPVELGVKMLLTARYQGGEEFAFTAPRHEQGDYTADLLFGSDLLRRPGIDAQEVCAVIREHTQQWLPLWQKYQLYPDTPDGEAARLG